MADTADICCYLSAGTLSGLMGGFFGMQGILHPVGANQRALYGNGADLFPDWQCDDDHRQSL